MHIKMLETRRGSEDGFSVAQYHAGDIYEVRDTMGRQFIRNGWATEIEAEAAPRPPLSGSAELVANTAAMFNQIFRPQPTRGSAPTNVATLKAKGIDL